MKNHIHKNNLSAKATAKPEVSNHTSPHEAAWNAMSTPIRSIVLSRLGVFGPRTWAAKTWAELDQEARPKIAEAMKPSELVQEVPTKATYIIENGETK